MLSLKVQRERSTNEPIPILSKFKEPHTAKFIYFTLLAHITDSKALVIKAISSACLKDSESEDEKTRTDAKARLELLTKWQK